MASCRGSTNIHIAVRSMKNGYSATRLNLTRLDSANTKPVRRVFLEDGSVRRRTKDHVEAKAASAETTSSVTNGAWARIVGDVQYGNRASKPARSRHRRRVHANRGRVRKSDR